MGLLDKHDVALSVRAYLADRGYDVSYVDGMYGFTEELTAKKGEDTFVVEAINWSNRKDADIVFALGKLVKRMNEVGFWYSYGLAMPREYYQFLRDFEAVGFDLLKVHLFLVDDYLSVKHLDQKQTVELIGNLRAGLVVDPDLLA